LPIADCRFEEGDRLMKQSGNRQKQLAIGNRQLEMI